MDFKKVVLPDSEIPRQWYNILADLPTPPWTRLFTREQRNRFLLRPLIPRNGSYCQQTGT